jgi:hypothetical protein
LGFNAYSTLQFTPLCPFTWNPGSVLDFDTFILVGPVDESRAAIYALHDQQTSPSTLPPMGWYDSTNNGSVVSGTIIVAGWSWALPGMKSVDVYVDGSRFASANFGLSRPDVAIYFPGAPSNTGFHIPVHRPSPHSVRIQRRPRMQFSQLNDSEELRVAQFFLSPLSVRFDQTHG